MVPPKKSRTGYIIYLYGCPIVWKSTQQRLVALSTLESEYLALSTATREVLHLRQLVTEMCTKLHLPRHHRVTARSRIFEDNQGAIAVATAPAMTPRTHTTVLACIFSNNTYTPPTIPMAVLNLSTLNPMKIVPIS